ncbi:hypothetical protein [Pseudosulfitobacter pseudonitzschiae]|nr:hypothetical protein [Pseudosulfitobacter pseudonitzschiae]UFG14013.1 hypothetical protein LOE32_21560 [Pseudosulfitobacter pseudonitzschiae]
MRRIEAVQAADKGGLRRTRGGVMGLLEVRLQEAGVEITPAAAIGVMVLIAAAVALGVWRIGLLPRRWLWS